RSEREIRWSSGEYDLDCIIPERLLFPQLKSIYTIFRPETGTWTSHIPLLSRKKRKGRGHTTDTVKTISKSVQMGILAPAMVTAKRRA
ncbi:unnamed protein product, partial [Amoebophrya sp. A25]